MSSSVWRWLRTGFLGRFIFPPLHPNDEPQHYLYAARFDGRSADPARERGQVSRDLQALAVLMEYGPHRVESRPIDLSADRAGQIDRLNAEADDPALAIEYVADDRVYKMIAHEGFEGSHPPTYYAVTGQVLRLGHVLGLGVRGRILLARLLSVLLGLVAAVLAMLLARMVWPGRWGLPVLVGLMRVGACAAARDCPCLSRLRR